MDEASFRLKQTEIDEMQSYRSQLNEKVEDLTQRHIQNHQKEVATAEVSVNAIEVYDFLYQIQNANTLCGFWQQEYNLVVRNMARPDMELIRADDLGKELRLRSESRNH